MSIIRNSDYLLRFGYFPSIIKSKNLITDIDYEYDSFSDLINERFETFDYGGTHIIPISGGLDSRFILAKVLEKVNSNNIIGVTFGSPNTLDFEIGKKICRKNKIEHIQINLDEISKNRIKFSQIKSEYLSGIISFPSYDIRHITNSTLWSGILGDSLFKIDTDSTNNDAVSYFKNKAMIDPESIPDEIYMKIISEFKFSDKINRYDQLGLNERYYNYYKYNVLPITENKIIEPFCDDKIINGIISLKKKNIFNYKNFMLETCKNILGEFEYKNDSFNFKSNKNINNFKNKFSKYFLRHDNHVNYCQYRKFIKSEIIHEYELNAKEYFKNGSINLNINKQIEKIKSKKYPSPNDFMIYTNFINIGLKMKNEKTKNKLSQSF